MWEKYFGHYIDIFSVKSLKKGLGVTTSYISYALDYGIIDGAIVVKAEDSGRPKAVVAKTTKDLREAIGTKWIITPMVDAIIKALRVERLERIAIIGTPCQCQAIRDIKEYPMQLGDIFERIKLIVGLFCMGSFTQDGFKTMLERKFGITLPEIKDAKIKSEEFIIELRNGTIKRIPIEDIKGDIKIACLSCDDFTARAADISFGNAGSTNGWRSAIVRSSEALSVLKEASEKGYLKFKKVENIDEIVKLSEEKMLRAKRMTKI